MEKIIKSISILLAFVLIGCSKIELNEIPYSSQNVELSTKSGEKNSNRTSTLNIFFYNSYSEDINVILKNVDYCVINNEGELSRINLFNGEMLTSNDGNLISNLNVPSSIVYSNIYIEYTYDAYQIVNNCCLAKDDVIKEYLTYDAIGNRITKWEPYCSYDYAFCPKFNEITFNPSVQDWN